MKWVPGAHFKVICYMTWGWQLQKNPHICLKCQIITIIHLRGMGHSRRKNWSKLDICQLWSSLVPFTPCRQGYRWGPGGLTSSHSLCTFLNCISNFLLLLSFLHSWCILDINHFLDKKLINIFSHSAWCLYALLIVPFVVQNLLHLI